MPGKPGDDGRTVSVTSSREDRLGGRNGAPAGREQILTTRVGLRFPPSLTYESWEQAGHQMSRVIDSSAWCLGDWLVYGQDRYTDRYQRAVTAAGLDYHTLRNYAWVTRRFDWSRRRAELSFQHHAEVAALPIAEQDQWLDRAANFGWSRNQIRKELREARLEATPTKPKTSLLPRIQTSGERVALWRRAAEQAQSDFGQWVVDTLDMAAAQELATGSADTPD